MKLVRTLFVLSVVGAAIAFVQRMMEDNAPAKQDIWRPADPLRPYSEPEA